MEQQLVLAKPAEHVPDFALRFTNLASARLGAKVISVSDEWFGAAPRMLSDDTPVFAVGRYDAHGKWMDGWETRRKRDTGYDHAIIRLGCKGIIYGVDIDTSHFTGNFPPAASIDACSIDGEPTPDTHWESIVCDTTLSADSHHFIAVKEPRAWTHLRLNIYPDGGVARLRVYGEGQGKSVLGEKEVELSSILLGGRVVAVSDAHYGFPTPILFPDKGINMGDGWETHRRRVPGNEWAIIQLGRRGIPERLVIDTNHNTGNYPDKVSVQAAKVIFGTDESLITQAMFWPELLPPQKMKPDQEHEFKGSDIADLGIITHVKINLHPDGGISRFRLFGEVS